MDAAAVNLPEEVSNIIHSTLPPREIGCLSLAVRSAASHDATWNDKLHKLGYPSVPCPQGFYFLVTSIPDRRHILLGALINTGVTAYVKTYLSVNTGPVFYYILMEYITNLTEEIAEVLKPSIADWLKNDPDMNCILANAMFFDTVMSLIAPEARQKTLQHLVFNYATWERMMHILVKYKLSVPNLYMFSCEELVKLLLDLPWMATKERYKRISYSFYEPYLEIFTEKHAANSEAYQPVMSLINCAPLVYDDSEEELEFDSPLVKVTWVGRPGA